MPGLFITLEGIDGCGKSTQHGALVEALEERGLDVLATREPGGTTAGERIRQLLSAGTSRLDARTELLLIVAARAQHVSEVVRPALQAGRTVVSDRYTDSSLAFQGYGQGLDLGVIEELNRFATGGLRPDLTILFDLDPELARARLSARRAALHPGSTETEITRFDDEKLDFHARVREGYLRLAESDPVRIRVVPAAGSIEQGRARVLKVIRPLIQNPG